MQPVLDWAYIGLAVAKGMAVIKCSHCQMIKREVNHWYFAWEERHGQRFCAVAWDSDPALVNEPEVLKLCGRNCAVQEFSAWMDRQRKIGDQ